MSSGVYRIEAVHSGQLIKVADASRNNPARVQQRPDNVAPCQQWKLTPVTSTPLPPPVFSTLLQAESFDINNGMAFRWI